MPTHPVPLELPLAEGAANFLKKLFICTLLSWAESYLKTNFAEAGRTCSDIEEILKTGNTNVSGQVDVDVAKNLQAAHIFRMG